MKLLIFSFVLTTLLNCSQVPVKTDQIRNYETSKMSDVFEAIDQKIKKYGTSNVLVVLDIDNTVLTTNNMLGSDQWFSWQSNMLFKKEASCQKFCVAQDFSSILKIQGKLFALSPMKLTEDFLPQKINALQKKGVTIILLTSRGKEFRSQTQKELKANGLDFSISPLGIGFPGSYTPYNLSHLSDGGLNEYDRKTANLGKPRSVSYMNGIYMTAGQHKGVMLKALLYKTNSAFDAIIFVDDHLKHTTRMSKTFSPMRNIDLTTFRYSKVDPIVQRFKNSNKNIVHQKWLRFKNTIQSVFKK